MNGSATTWRRSSYCSGAASTCVEVAIGAQMVTVRDSKVSASPILRFTLEEWRAFVRGVRAGEFEV
jgi:hypothetical protein